MDSFEHRLVADLATIADTLPPLGPAARPRRTPPLSPLVASVAVLALALGAAYVASSDSPSSPRPAAPPSSTAPANSAQPADPVVTTQVLERLQRAYAGLPDAAGFEMDGATGVVTVSWAGPVPAVVAAEAGTRADGVVVRIVRSAYSADELAVAMDDLAAGYPLATVPGFNGLGPDPAMTGLIVAVDPMPEPSTIADLEDDLSEAAGVPVTLGTLGPSS